MRIRVQKRLAADVLKCSPKRVKFDTAKLEDVKEAITKADIRGLVSSKIVTRKPVKGVSRVRARIRKDQRKKGRQQGQGSRKGTKTARLPSKDAWIAKIRTQRKFIKALREKKLIDAKTFRMIYRKCKGGFFRNRSHIKIYMNDNKLFKK